MSGSTTAQPADIEIETSRRKTDTPESSLEQIQGILFGEKMGEIEARLGEIENRLHARLDNLSRDVNTQIGNLRDEVKNKTDQLNEANLRSDGELAKLDESLIDHDRRIKAQAVEMQSASQELTDELRRTVADLEDRKVDGVLLSAFLSETAKGISKK